MNNEITITTIDEVINQLSNYLGAWIFEDGKLRDDVLAIDTRELLEAFKEYEIPMEDALKVVNGLVNEYGDEMFTSFGELSFSRVADVADNSYNWSSPLSHDINITEFKYNDNTYVAIMVHLGGDIRGNYSYYFILECDFDDLFNIEFYPMVNITDYLVADLRWYSDTYTVYDYDKQEDVGEYYEIEMEDLIERLKEDGVDIM